MNTHCARYHRVEVLGALASVLTIWLVTGILVYEAVNRVLNPVPVNGKRELLSRPDFGTLCDGFPPCTPARRVCCCLRVRGAALSNYHRLHRAFATSPSAAHLS